MMMKLSKLLFLFSFVFFPVLILMNPTQAEAAATQRKIVVFKENISVGSGRKILVRFGRNLIIGKELKIINAFAIELPEESVDILEKLPGVKRIDEDAEVQALEFPNVIEAGICDQYPWWPWCTPRPNPTPSVTPTPISASPTPTVSLAARPSPTPSPLPGQVIPWGVSRIGAPAAWDYSTGENVRVAVLDTGIDTDHSDIVDNVGGCLNFIDPSKTCEDDNGHGTHVSGIIGARNNAIGVVGVAPLSKIYALKVLNKRGSGYLSDIIEGIDWSVVNDMQVINMSLGTTSNVISFREAVQRAVGAGVVVVAAAGNSGPGANTVNYPAKYPEVIAVAATDSGDNVPSWSSRGPEVDIAAPGVGVNSTYLRNGYKNMSGTSMSSPHVAGAVALRLALYPNESPAEVELKLESAADYLPFDPTWVGAGLVNAYKFVIASN